MGDSLYRRLDRLPVDKGHHRSRRQSPRRGGRDHLTAPAQGHRAGHGAAGPRRHRMERACRRVLPRSRRHAVHEPYPPRQPLRPGPAPLAARPLHRHRLRPHRAQGRRAPHRLRTRPLQHSEHRDFSLVAQRLQRYQHLAHGGCDQHRDRPALLSLQLAGHGHPAVPPRRFAGRADRRGQRSRSMSSIACAAASCATIYSEASVRPITGSAKASSSTSAVSRSTPTRFRWPISPEPTAAGPTCPRPAAPTPRSSIPSSAASRFRRPPPDQPRLR